MKQAHLKYYITLAACGFFPLVASAREQFTDVGTPYDFQHIMAYVVTSLLIFVFVMVFLNFVIVFRQQDQRVVNRRQSARLGTVMLSGRIRVWTYDTATRHYFVLSSTGQIASEYNPIDFSVFFDRDDFELLRAAVFELCEGRRTSSEVKIRSRSDNPDEQEHYEVKLSAIHTDASGHATTVLGMERNVTEEYRKQEKINSLLMRYHTVFDSSIVDMVYYDKFGVLTDINDKACREFNITDRKLVLRGNYRLQDNPMFSYIDIGNVSSTHVTALVDFNKYRPVENQQAPGIEGMMYYESVVSPIHDKNGELEGIYMTGRNVTEMVESYHLRREGALKLERTTDAIRQYIGEINYAMQVTGAWLLNYFPDNHTVEMTTDLTSKKFRFSQLRCIRMASPPFRRHVSSLLNRMDHRLERPMEQLVETVFRDQRGRAITYLIALVPMFDDHHRVTHYFGMMRNQTDMVETERRLAVETKKAQETELLKQSFLTNMSYEIRTPLNTVIGFAELFETDHDPEDEPVFVNEIRTNTNKLLALINDILFLSRLDANMEEYKIEDTDVALHFDSWCQLGLSGIKPDVKTVIDNPYNHLVVNIDAQNLGRVVQNLCQRAAANTEKGFVRTKCEYRHGELTIAIEDTGRGIAPDMLPHVFERFARNPNNIDGSTGLEMPIIQTLVQQMGGTIDFQSELDKGSTAWVTIPCEAKTIDRKVELNV